MIFQVKTQAQNIEIPTNKICYVARPWQQNLIEYRLLLTNFLHQQRCREISKSFYDASGTVGALYKR